MDVEFLSELKDADELEELKRKLTEISALGRTDERRLEVLGFASELCIAVSTAAGPSDDDISNNREFLKITAEGSHVSLYAIAKGGKRAPLRLVEIVEEMIQLSRQLTSEV